MTQPEERNKLYDFYKGLLIFCITWGHVIKAFNMGENEPWIYMFIRTFDLPMFAMISGYFLKMSVNRRGVFPNILNKVGTLLLPALFWELVFGLIKRDIRFGTSMWFLYAVFISAVIIILLDKIRNAGGQICTFLICLIGLLLYKDPFHTEFVFVPMVFGYYLTSIRSIANNPKWKILKKDVRVFILFALWIILLCFWKKDWSIWIIDGCVIGAGWKIPIILYRYLIGIVGALCMMTIWKFIYDNIKIWNKAKKYTELFGEYSLEEYILQCLFVSYFGAIALQKIVEFIGMNPFTLNQGLLCFVITPIVSVVTLIFQYYLQKRMCKIPKIGKYVFGSPLSQLVSMKKK